MPGRREVRVSKLLSLVLRHEPERIGLRLDRAGGAPIDELLAALARHGTVVSPGGAGGGGGGQPEAAVRHRRHPGPPSAPTRAMQSRSTWASSPWCHRRCSSTGQPRSSHEPVLLDGLLPMGRQHVHLSADVGTARVVGRRHGAPVVLEVAAGAMQADGQAFLRAANGVWLVDHVPPAYLRPVDG